MSHLCHKYGFNEKKKKLWGFFSLSRLTKLYQVYTVTSGFARLNLKTKFCGRGKKEPVVHSCQVFFERLATIKAIMTNKLLSTNLEQFLRRIKSPLTH